MSAARTATDNGTGGALSLRSWFLEAEAAASIARQVADTPFVPDSLKRYLPADRDGNAVLDLENTVAVVAAALLAGQELGFSPMASLRSMDIIKGTPALRAIALRALVQSHGHDIMVVQSTMTLARVRACRAGGEVQESVWTLDRAKLMGLYPGKENGQWRRQPQSQLVARATAEAARWVAADSILGLPYISEELRDQDDEIPPPVDDEDTSAPTRPGRKRARAALAAPMTPAPPPANPTPGVPPITREQVTLLNAGLRQLGLKRAEAAAFVSQHAGRAVGGSAELTYDEAVRVLLAIGDEAERVRAEQDAQPPADAPASDDDQTGGQGDAAPDA